MSRVKVFGFVVMVCSGLQASLEPQEASAERSEQGPVVIQKASSRLMPWDLAFINESMHRPKHSEIDKEAQSNLSMLELLEPSNPNHESLWQKTVSKLEEAARTGNLTSLYGLGMAYEKERSLSIAYDFYLLTLGESWLRGEVFEGSRLRTESFWDLLTGELGAQTWQKKFSGSSVVNFFPLETQDNGSSKSKKSRGTQPRALKTSEKLDRMDFLESNDFRENPFLDQRTFETWAIKAKVLRIKHEDPFGMLGQIFHEKKDYAKAAQCYEQSGTYLSLTNLGVLYASGLVGLKSDGTPDYEKAASYLKRCGTPQGLNALGLLYTNGSIEKKKNGTPDYEQAERCFRRSMVFQMPEAFANLGTLLSQGVIGRKADGLPDYETAKENYLKAKTSEAYYSLGVMSQKGFIERLEDGKPNYKAAEAYYRRSGTPKAFNNLGLLYYYGHIDKNADGQPNLALARSYFERANTPDALHTLGVLYLEGSIKSDNPREDTPNYKKAIELLEKSNTLVARFQLYSTYKPRKAGFLGMLEEDLSKKIEESKHKLEEALESAPQSFIKAFYQGQFLFLEQKYEEASFYFNQAMLLGDSYHLEISGLEFYMDQVQKILSAHNKLSVLDNPTPSLERQSSQSLSRNISEEAQENVHCLVEFVDEEDEEEEVDNPTDSSESDSTEEVASSFEGKNVTEESTLKGQSEASKFDSLEEVSGPSDETEINKKSRLEVSRERKKQRIQVKIAKIREKTLKRLESGPLTNPSLGNTEAEINKALKVTYQTKSVESKCLDEEYKNQVEELLKDISESAWGTQGRGRPEILHQIRCVHPVTKKRLPVYSRRINHKDRLVYTVLGPREVLIIECGGHYDTL